MPTAMRARVHAVCSGRERSPGCSQHLCFILPTIYDPFSNACLEALAAGLRDYHAVERVCEII